MAQTRRQFVHAGIAAAAASTAHAAKRKFTIAFVPGSIGIKVDQGRAIELAAKHGFESVEPYGRQLLAHGVSKYVDAREKAGLQWAASSLTASLRAEEADYQSGLKELPAIAKALQQAGVQRVGTAISSASDTLNYLDNFRQHKRRLREVGGVLADQGLRLGLEYLGTKHIWTSRRHAFVHSLAECMELISEAGQKNIGVVLDSWHWWTARDSVEAIRALTNDQVVAGDLNDAPGGIEIDDQKDYQRELPLTTGVIDAKAFLEALVLIGFDGPIRCEPFNKKLDDMDDDPAAAATIKSMKKAFAMVG